MYTTEKQAPGRLTRRRSGRRWLLIPALCAVLILAVVLIVELGKKPQVPEDWSVDLVTLPNGLEVDKRCYDALMEMIDGCYDAGLTPVICSAYRAQDFQETLYNNKVSEWMDQGYGLEDAKAKAGRQVAVPGTSEHQLGLAVDIVDVSYQLLDTNQENTDVQKWLLENSWRYGFILRYPTDKTDITGIVYEPWHYRYVGKEYAKEIYEKGVCLEQYLEQWGK